MNVCVVTGGGSGIGKAIAKRFCDAGAKVLITGRNEEKLKNAAEEINSKKTGRTKKEKVLTLLLGLPSTTKN